MRLQSRRFDDATSFLARASLCVLLALGISNWGAFTASAGPLDDVAQSFAFVTGASGLIESGTDERLLAIAAVVIPEEESAADPGGETAGFILSAGGSAEVRDDDDEMVAILESGDATFVEDGSELTIAAGSSTATIVRFAFVDDGEPAPWSGDSGVIELETTSVPGSNADSEQMIALRFAYLDSGTQATIGDGQHIVPVVIPLAGTIDLSSGESIQQGNLAIAPEPGTDGMIGITAIADNTFVVCLVIGPDLESTGRDPETDGPGSDPTPTPESGGVIPGVGDDDPDPSTDPGDQTDQPDEDTPEDDEPELNELDTDSDGISDDGETGIYNTDSNNSDSDGDGLLDGQEVFSQFFPTNPNLFDTDGDGLGDNDELNNAAGPLNPLVADCDADGLLDGEEVNSTGTQPCNPDSNGDGLNDFEELTGVAPFPSTNPLVADTDGDGINDGIEIALGSNPVDINDFP